MGQMESALGTKKNLFHVLTNQTYSLNISASRSIVLYITSIAVTANGTAQCSHSTLMVIILCLLSEVIYIKILMYMY